MPSSLAFCVGVVVLVLVVLLGWQTVQHRGFSIYLLLCAPAAAALAFFYFSILFFFFSALAKVAAKQCCQMKM